MTTATFITEKTSTANELMRSGWRLVKDSLAVAAAASSPGDTTGLTDRGIRHTTQEVRVESRTYVLELPNAKRHINRWSGTECSGCPDCLMTGYVPDLLTPQEEKP